MTLCVAWIRHGQNDEGMELVFATDSRLRGGEAWDSGIKLFDLGRKDCLLCFAGATQRAYPLILHGSNSIRTHIDWSDPRFDLYDVLDHLCQLFTRLGDTITEPPSGMTVEELRSDAQFLFGGWSWRRQKLCIWRIYYSDSLHTFASEAVQELETAWQFTFLGDNVEEAKQLLIDDLYQKRKMTGVLDMEPLCVLANMSRNEADFNLIGGALQVAKVYRSGNSEFFGMMWQSTMNGKPTFLGRELNPYDAPPMRFLDPDTGDFIENLPTRFEDLGVYNFGQDQDFVERCYPDYQLKTSLREAERDRLGRIFRTTAYQEFVTRRETPGATADEAEESPKGSEGAVGTAIVTVAQAVGEPEGPSGTGSEQEDTVEGKADD